MMEGSITEAEKILKVGSKSLNLELTPDEDLTLGLFYTV